MQPDNDLLAERLWQHRGQKRPAFAVEPGKGQESVWDYPRPPILVEDSRLVEVCIDECLSVQELVIGLTVFAIGTSMPELWNVLWSEGTESEPLSGRFEWFSLLISAAALVALWRYKVGIIPVICACAAAGLAYSLLT